MIVVALCIGVAMLLMVGGGSAHVLAARRESHLWQLARESEFDPTVAVARPPSHLE